MKNSPQVISTDCRRRIPTVIASGITLLVLACGFTARGATYTSLAALQAASASLTTDDFESGPWLVSGNKPKPTVNLGVSWNALDTLFVTAVASHSGTHAISDVDGALDRDQLFAVLPANIRAVGGWVNGSTQGTSVVLIAYDASNNVLESFSMLAPNNFAFMGISTALPISRVEWRKPPVDGINDDFALDDFVFGNVVPEPSVAWLFLSSAFAALGFWRRRR